MTTNITTRALPLVVLLISLTCMEAWGQIVFQSDTTRMTNPTSGNASTTLTIFKPAGVVAGDFMVAQITFEKGTDIVVTAPAGWTLARAQTNQSSDIGQTSYYKVANAADVAAASYAWTFSQSVKAAGGILRYSGVNLLHPDGPIVTSSAGNGDGSSLAAPSVNALKNSMLVGLYGEKKKEVTLSTPAGMTERYHFQNPQDVTIKAADEPRVVDGATGARTSTTTSSDKWVAQLIVLRGNTIPVFTPPSDQTADEGEDKAFDIGSFADADAHASWEITVEWGDGSADDVFNVLAAGDIGTRNHVYTDNGIYTVTVTVDDGFDTDSDTFEITVSNVAPTVVAASNQSSDEGEDKAFSIGSFSDPGVEDDPWDVEVDWDDGSTNTTFQVNAQGSLGSKSHTYADNGTYTVTVTVTDKDGGVSNSATFDITVDNVVPVVTAASDQAANVGIEKAFDLGSFTDAGIDDDPWDVEVDWGDGSTNTTFQLNAQGSLGQQNHTYASANTFTVSVTVTDKDGGVSDPVTFEVDVTVLLHSISGIVKDGADNPIEGVTVTANAGFDQVKVTGLDGLYEITDIPHGSNLTITPTKAGYSFTPTDRGYTDLMDDQTDQDFVGTLSEPTFADVEVDGVSTRTCDCKNLTFLHQVAGDNRLLIVGISLETGDPAKRVSSVKYAGVNLTRLAERRSPGGDPRVDVWYLVDPPTGSNSAEVALTEKNKILVGAASFTGVHQTTPITGTVTGGGSSGSPAMTVASSEGSLVMDVVGSLKSSISPGAGQAALWNMQMYDSGKRGGASIEAGASPSVAMTWSGSEKWAGVGFSINPAQLSKGGALQDGLAVTDIEVAPERFELLHNYPNPFNPSTEIKFSVEAPANATLHVYNVTGQIVATLFDGVAEAGRYYTVRLDASRLASGTYFYRLQSGAKSDVKTMLLLK